MKIRLLLLCIVPLLLSSCGYVSKSTVHSRSAWKAHKASPPEPLPAVKLKVGQRTLAYKHRVGFPPMFGGYLPSLLPGDARIAKAELVQRGRGHDTYLTALKPGITNIYFVNGLVSAAYNRENLSERDKAYRVIATP